MPKMASTGRRNEKQSALFCSGLDERAVQKLSNKFIDMKDIHEIAGLVPAGKDEDGEQQWLGTDRNWAKYRKLVEDKDEMVDGEIKQTLMGNSKSFMQQLKKIKDKYENINS